MRAQADPAKKGKTQSNLAGTCQAISGARQDRGFDAFPAILIAFVMALIGTTAVALRYDMSWVWWLPTFMCFGVITTAVIISLIYLNEK